MDWTLELVVVPVSDVDRARAFYTDKAGFNVLLDTSAGDAFRLVQLSPPGSACAIAIGTGISKMAPGSIEGLHPDRPGPRCRASGAATTRSSPAATRTATSGYP